MPVRASAALQRDRRHYRDRPGTLVTVGGVQRMVRVDWTLRFSRWARVSLQTVGGTGTEDVVLELAQNGQDLRVWFGVGTWITWRSRL